MEHTATPWKVAEPSRDGMFIVNQDDDVVAESYPDNNQDFEANAAFICRAVNSHEELLEACRDALDILECNCAVTKCVGKCTKAIVEAAIARAEGK